MEFIKALINENNSSLTDSLSSAGFSLEQVSQFLPEAASSISDAINISGVEQIVSGVASGGSGKLLNSIDIIQIASKTGMSSEQVKEGFEAILPAVTNIITQNGGSIGDALSSVIGGGSGGLFGAAKKLFD